MVIWLMALMGGAVGLALLDWLLYWLTEER
jgi:hypothetical protein